ncbi:MAG TPA: hypothetical protein VHE35_18755, partial [Kofleriaceae bacterium]|nr:hypothetical protein [Kofleriaceae bacterium]
PPSMAMAPAAAAQTAPMAVAPGGGAADDGADGARSDRPAKTAAARHADQELAPLDEAPPPPPPLEPSIGAGSVAGSAAGSAAAADVAADADDADHAEHADKGSGDEPTLETRLSKETPRGLALARRVTVTARIAAVDVRGGLAGDIVLAKVRARAEALRACAGDAAPGVAFELELTVAASGKVTASRATGGAADADACLARELRGLGFAAASKATTAHLRLDLAAE